VKHALNDDQSETLRPMTTDEVRAADPELIEFGAHSHTHCIFRNETLARRKEEITTSIRKVSEWTGRNVLLFSYPNGEPGDFAESDKAVLRAEGIEAAVTGIGGANNRRSDLLALKRYPLTLQHGEAAFRAEVTGFRNVLLAANRKWAQ
jgi:peptidoglycan/xylan/chitin deacetylase (PgdA/CDA1 family)